ncbi:MAG: hypothetical protein RLZZ579_1151 [Actinomycetota bacterium]|jgi:hypothetical protein
MKIKRFLAAVTGVILLGLTSGCSLLVDQGVSPKNTAHANGIVLEDSRGTWNQVELADNNAIFDRRYIVTAVPDGVSSNLTDDEMYSAAVWVVKFISSEGVDSIAADNSNAWGKWVDEVAPKYLDPKSLKKLTGKPSYIDHLIGGSAVDRSLIIINSQSGNFDGMLVRGGQRVVNMGFDGEISAVASGSNKNAVTISGTFFTTYKIEDAWSLGDVRKKNPILTEEEIEMVAPKLFDNVPGKGDLRFSFSYTLLKQTDGAWKISAYENDYIFEPTINQ